MNKKLLKLAQKFENLINNPYDNSEGVSFEHKEERNLESIIQYLMDEAAYAADDAMNNSEEPTAGTWWKEYTEYISEAVEGGLTDKYYRYLPRETLNGPLTESEVDEIIAVINERMKGMHET